MSKKKTPDTKPPAEDAKKVVPTSEDERKDNAGPKDEQPAAARVNAPGGLRLRPSASIEQAELCILPFGATVAVLDVASGPDGTAWASVKTEDDNAGHVMAEFLDPIHD